MASNHEGDLIFEVHFLQFEKTGESKQTIASGLMLRAYSSDLYFYLEFLHIH